MLLSRLLRRNMSTTDGKPSMRVLELWKSAQAVCFDVDSTVITEEGIDVLANVCGKGKEVSEWTQKAMGGSTPFEVALAARLDLCKPSTRHIEQTLREHPFKLTPNVKNLFSQLHAKDKHVYLVSGGFKQMILPVAKELNIIESRLYANNLLFDEISGDFKGFDKDAYTSRSGGKPRVIELLKKTYGYSPIIMVGDGATDMEARPPADVFIGYGGVSYRESIKKGSDWYITDMKELIEQL